MESKNTDDCMGNHHFFCAGNSATDAGQVLIFLVCTNCGEGRKVEFEVENPASVIIKK